MDTSKHQQKISIVVVIVIFFVLYLGELGLGAGAFYYIVLPKITDLQQKKITQQFEDRKKSDPQLAEMISLYQQLSPEVTKQTPEITKTLESKNYDGAIKAVNDLQSKIKNDADKVFSNLILVQAYIGKKDRENTKKSAQSLIKYGPKFSLGYRYMSQVDLDEKNYKDALDQARKAVEIDPNQAYNHYLLSIALSWNYQDEEALKEIKQAVQLDPSNTQYKKELDYQQKNTTTQTNTQTTSKTQANPVSQTSGPGYSQTDVKSWQDELSYINQDLSNIPKFLGNSSYDQGKLNQMSTLLNQRNTIANQIYTKMANNQTLTTQDQRDINTYNQLTSQYASLAIQVFPR